MKTVDHLAPGLFDPALTDMLLQRVRELEALRDSQRRKLDAAWSLLSSLSWDKLDKGWVRRADEWMDGFFKP